MLEIREEAANKLPITYCPECRFCLVCADYLQGNTYTIKPCKGRLDIINQILAIKVDKDYTIKDLIESKERKEYGGFTKEELADLRHNACDDTIG